MKPYFTHIFYPHVHIKNVAKDFLFATTIES